VARIRCFDCFMLSPLQFFASRVIPRPLGTSKATSCVIAVVPNQDIQRSPTITNKDCVQFGSSKLLLGASFASPSVSNGRELDSAALQHDFECPISPLPWAAWQGSRRRATTTSGTPREYCSAKWETIGLPFRRSTQTPFNFRPSIPSKRGLANGHSPLSRAAESPRQLSPLGGFATSRVRSAASFVVDRFECESVWNKSSEAYVERPGWHGIRHVIRRRTVQSYVRPVGAVIDRWPR
jgi:hypothetical protein